MISFQISEEGRRALECEARAVPMLREMLDTLCLGEDLRAVLYDGHLLVRAEVDEGEFAFFYPQAYADGDTERALCALEDYALRQEIPLVFLDLSGKERDTLVKRYPLSRVYDMDDGGRFVVEVRTELSLLSDIPTVRGRRLTMRSPDVRDAATYAAMVRDIFDMRHYGYNELLDDPDVTDEERVQKRLREFDARTALPFFLYDEGGMVGEVTLFAFRGRGSAEVAVRIVKEARGRGYFREALSLAIDFARDGLGLTHLCADCHEANEACVHLLPTLLGEGERRGDTLHFCRSLT